jgi:hypothetical protein
MRRRDGTPLMVVSGQASTLIRMDLAGSDYDEAWLQRLLFHNPNLLPTEQIEPGFGDLVAICQELPLAFGPNRSGALDNVFVTAEGGLFFVEAKLWRNPEARRAVVAQAIEYAAAIFRMNYLEFEAAVLHARQNLPNQVNSLFDLVKAENKDIGEADFIDAVTRNLRRGRAIIAVVGDGIREDLELLAELLQTHAGDRFTFALVEMGLFESADKSLRVVVPSVLAKTALIERGVVQILDTQVGGQQIVINSPSSVSPLTQKSRSISMGEDEFFERLDRRDPGSAAVLKSFLSKAESLGVTADWQRALNLKHPFPEGNPLNLGTIDKDGFVETSPASWWDRTKLGRSYNEALAKQFGGLVRDMKDGTESAARTAVGKMPRLTDLLPAHEEAWLNAMSRYIQDALAATTES